MTGVDRDGLHILLWRRRGANASVTVDYGTFAAELQVDRKTAIRLVHRMVEEGRLLPVRGSSARRRRYQVVDPVSWELSSS